MPRNPAPAPNVKAIRVCRYVGRRHFRVNDSAEYVRGNDAGDVQEENKSARQPGAPRRNFNDIGQRAGLLAAIAKPLA